MPKANPIPTTSRRNILAGSAALLTGAAGFVKPPPLPWRNGPRPAPQPAADDAELLTLRHAFLAAHATVTAWNAGDVTEDIGEAAHDRWWECVEAMTDIPATTPAGLRAKAEAALLASGLADGHGGPDEDLARSALRDAAAGRAAA
jgi:hypothetical protein